MVMAGMPRDMGTLESVLEMPSSRKGMSLASNASAAACTTGLPTGVNPVGRSPINTNSTLISPLFQRAFSSATAAIVTSFTRASSVASSSELFERMSMAKTASAAMEFTEVPPATVPTVNVVLG